MGTVARHARPGSVGATNLVTEPKPATGPPGSGESTEPQRGERRRQEALAVGALAILVVVFFGETLSGRAVFYWRDIHLGWVPQIETFVQSVASGSWPTWDPLTAFGQPMLADAAAQVLYPPTWLNLLMRPWVYCSLYTSGHAFFSTASLFFLARRYGLSVGGALTAAALWLLSGPYVSLIDPWNHFAGASWTPLVLLAFDKAATDRRLRSWLFAGAVLAGQVLTGSPDVSAMTLALVVGQALGCHVRWKGGRATGYQGLGALALAVLLAAGFSAGQWIPTLELVLRATRGALSLEARTFWSVPPLGLLDTLFPGAWDVRNSSEVIRAALFSGREPFLKTLYLGLPSLGLVVAAFISRHPRRNFLVMSCGLACLLALGHHAPFYEWATTILPPIRMFRYPVKTMIVAALAWALLGGIGYDALRSLPGSGRLPRYLALGPIALATVVALFARMTLSSSPAPVAAILDAEVRANAALIFAPAAARLGLAGLAGAGVFLALALACFRERSRSAWVSLAAVLIVGELALQHRTLTPVAPRALYSYRPEVLSGLGDLTEARLYVYDYTAFPGKSQRYLGRLSVGALQLPVEGWDSQAAGALAQITYLTPQIAGRFGLRRGYDWDVRNLYPARQFELIRALREVERTPAHVRFLRLAGITHVVALHDPGFEDLDKVGTFPSRWPESIRVFRVPRTLPRAYLVDGVRVAAGLDSLRILADPAFDLEHEVVLSVGPTRLPGTTPVGSSRIVRAKADRLLIETELSRPGFLVVNDSFDPGWKATVDGRSTPILVANSAFRAVALPPGTHQVEMIYKPWSVGVGLTISGLTMGLACLLGAALPRRRRTSS